MKLSELFQMLWQSASSNGPFPYAPEPDGGVSAFYLVIPTNDAGMVSTPFFVALTATDIVYARATYAYTQGEVFESVTLNATSYPLKYVVHVDRQYRSKFQRQAASFSGPDLDITVHFETSSGMPDFKPPMAKGKVEGDYAGFCKELIKVRGHSSNQ